MLLVAALLFLPTAQASGPDLVSTEIFCSSARFGAGPFFTDSVVAITGWQAAGVFAITLRASDLVVNWTREEFLEGDSSDRIKTNASQGNQTFRRAAAFTTSDVSSARFWITVSHAAFSGTSKGMLLEPARSLEPAREEGVPALDPEAWTPDGHVQATFADADAKLIGDFTMDLWGPSLDVVASGRALSFRSGTWTEPIVALPQVAGPGLHHRYFQSLRVTARDAEMRLELAHRNATVTASGFQTGPTSVELTDMEARVDGETETISKPHLRLETVENVHIANSTTMPLAVGINLRAPRDDVANLLRNHDEPAFARFRLADGRPRLDGPAWPIAFAGGSVGLAALFLARRIQTPSIESAERALGQGRWMVAHRMAQRLLRNDPTDVDAAFVLGTSLLSTGRYRALRRALEPLVEALEVERQASLAFLLAVAARHEGDIASFERWADRAAAEPILRERMQLEGLWPTTGASFVLPYIA